MNEPVALPVPMKPRVTLLERLDRLDHYCDELEAMTFHAVGDETDEDITGQIERIGAGLEEFGRPHLRAVSK